MNRFGRVPAMVILVTAAVATAGCGYSTESMFPKDVSSVHVPIWTVGKDVYRREIETRLTEALIKRLAMDTPYKIASKGQADTELTGTITRIEQRVLSNNPDTGQPRDMEITMVVSFRWTDLRSGKVRVTIDDFKVTGIYLPSSPLSEDFFQGSEDVLNEAAKRIVEKLETEW